MKRIALLFLILISLTGCTTGAKDGMSDFDTSAEERPEKIHDDIAPGSFRQVNISGNAKSIVIRSSSSENFEFYNEDLNPAHTYTVLCDESGETLDIEITMENPDEDNNILGSVLIDIPKKEFEKIEIAGDFKQVSLYTINSEVLIHANDSLVNLDLEADCLEHNITLDGSVSNAFRMVSVYFDNFPDNVSMDLNVIQNGTINDPEDILKENGLESGSGKPIISINSAKEINIYSKE